MEWSFNLQWNHILISYKIPKSFSVVLTTTYATDAFGKNLEIMWGVFYLL